MMNLGFIRVLAICAVIVAVSILPRALARPDCWDIHLENCCDELLPGQKVNCIAFCFPEPCCGDLRPDLSGNTWIATGGHEEGFEQREFCMSCTTAVCYYYAVLGCGNPLNPCPLDDELSALSCAFNPSYGTFLECP